VGAPPWQSGRIGRVRPGQYAGRFVNVETEHNGFTSGCWSRPGPRSVPSVGRLGGWRSRRRGLVLDGTTGRPV